MTPKKNTCVPLKTVYVNKVNKIENPITSLQPFSACACAVYFDVLTNKKDKCDNICYL